MAKVFTITEGMENLGALKSGGQGSVYKARRSSEIITAIKILPTPISSENDDDKNYRSFQNEVQKLKKVNEVPNPNVVSIIASGITSSGNLPFIEMEYIEGPDLAELLTAPHDPVFTIKETIKVADHLSNALAHCHRADVKHGDIKSNNVKFNQRTGNYILLDFGLSVMSDEQRRTSIRHAGAIEFMAPEQSAGEMLFETDIYSFGIILFELLSGNVPFPLFNKGEIARNAVMVSHMEAPPPDLLSLRRLSMPGSWSDEKKEREMIVPAWLVEMIYKCLEKLPSKRFKNGKELQDFMHAAMTWEENKKAVHVSPAGIITDSNDELLKKHVDKLELQVAEKDNTISDLQYQIEVKDRELYQLHYTENYYPSKKKGISKSLFFLVLFIALGLAGYNFYYSFVIPYQDSLKDTSTQINNKISNSIDSSLIPKNKPVKKIKAKPKRTTTVPVPGQRTEVANKSLYYEPPVASGEVDEAKRYRVTSTAYFYDLPDESSRNNYYLNVSDETVTALDETDDFIHIEFINIKGETATGWLSKKKLSQVHDY